MNAQQIRIIWVALTMSVFIYAVLAFVVVPVSSKPFEAALSDPVILILHLAGLGMLMMSFVVPMLLLRASATAARLRMSMIVRWAMTETTAVFGLLAAFLAQDARLFVPLGVLALAGMLMAYPKQPTAAPGPSSRPATS